MNSMPKIHGLGVGIVAALFMLSLGCGGSKKVTQVEVPAQEPQVVTPEPAAPPASEPPKEPEPAPLEPLVLEVVHFDFDKSDLRPEARDILAQHAQKLKERPNELVLIEGHCDERGTIEYNLALGDRRAMSVRDYLVSLGIEAARITTISYGKERPLDAGHNEEAWAKNRRGAFVIKVMAPESET